MANPDVPFPGVSAYKRGKHGGVRKLLKMTGIKNTCALLIIAVANTAFASKFDCDK